MEVLEERVRDRDREEVVEAGAVTIGRRSSLRWTGLLIARMQGISLMRGHQGLYRRNKWIYKKNLAISTLQ